MGTVNISQCTDEDLVRRVSGAEPDCDMALGELLSRYGRRLHRHFMMSFRNEEMARDLVQGVFERVIRARDRLPDEGGFRPWLWTIAFNLARNAKRQSATGPGRLSLDAMRESGEIPLGDRLPDPSPTPRLSAEIEERSRQLVEAVNLLEPPHRDVILLKYFQDLPCNEVAQILEISEGTVWSRTHRALSRLREMLGSEQSAAGGDSA